MRGRSYVAAGAAHPDTSARPHTNTARRYTVSVYANAVPPRDTSVESAIIPQNCAPECCQLASRQLVRCSERKVGSSQFVSYLSRVPSSSPASSRAPARPDRSTPARSRNRLIRRFSDRSLGSTSPRATLKSRIRKGASIPIVHISPRPARRLERAASSWSPDIRSRTKGRRCDRIRIPKRCCESACLPSGSSFGSVRTS